MRESEVINLMREVEKKAPDEFTEIVGIMKGIKLMTDRYEKEKIIHKKKVCDS